MAAFAINNAVNGNIVHSPSFLNKGVHPRMPSAMFSGTSAQSSFAAPTADQFSVHVQKAMVIAKQCLIDVKQRQELMRTVVKSSMRWAKRSC